MTSEAIRMRTARLVLLVALVLPLVACTRPGPTSPRTREATTTPPAIEALTPTIDDGVSPSYKPDAPVRESVGSGHVLTGTVRSSVDGSPIERARVELWPEYAGKGHPDEARATVFTDARGRYRFECDPPEHIHVRVSAPGYTAIGINSYHPEGASSGTMDVVLRRDTR